MRLTLLLPACRLCRRLGLASVVAAAGWFVAPAAHADIWAYVDARGILHFASEKLGDRYELFLDGVRVTECGAGGRLTLDTTALADGHHDLRVVAIETSSIETQGRSAVPVMFANHDRTIELTVEPLQVSRKENVRVNVRGNGISGAVIFATGRVLGRTTGPESSIEVPAELLGRGTVMVRATGRGGTTPAENVNAVPVAIEVTD
jgi:hypothetical protein